MGTYKSMKTLKHVKFSCIHISPIYLVKIGYQTYLYIKYVQRLFQNM